MRSRDKLKAALPQVCGIQPVRENMDSTFSDQPNQATSHMDVSFLIERPQRPPGRRKVAKTIGWGSPYKKYTPIQVHARHNKTSCRVLHTPFLDRIPDVGTSGVVLSVQKARNRAFFFKNKGRLSGSSVSQVDGRPDNRGRATGNHQRVNGTWRPPAQPWTSRHKQRPWHFIDFRHLEGQRCPRSPKLFSSRRVCI